MNDKELQYKISEINNDRLHEIAESRKTKSWLPSKSRRIYTDQLICLLSLSVMAVWRSGMRAFLLIAVSVLISIFVDYFCCKVTKKVYNPRDLSTICAGLCIALMMPASISYIMVGCGAALAMTIKHIFGGKNNYIFNPTAVALAFFIICYPTKILLFPPTGEVLPVFGEITAKLSSGIESFLMKLGTTSELSTLDILLGNFQGPIGTTHVLVLAVCGVCMIFRRSVNLMTTLSSLSVILIITTLFPLYDNFFATMVFELIGGYLFFGLLFLATDPQTIPKSKLGQLYYGIVLGLLIVAFRYFGRVEGSFVFALLSANAFSVGLDRLGERTTELLDKLSADLKENLTSYERISERAQRGELPLIGDTQEISLSNVKFDTPPIDNKVIKINRKKQRKFSLSAFLDRIKPNKVNEKVLPPLENEEEEIKLNIKKVLQDRKATKNVHDKEKIKRIFNEILSKFSKNNREDIAEPDSSETAANSDEVTLITENSPIKTEQSDIDITDFEEVKEFTQDKENDIENE